MYCLGCVKGLFKRSPHNRCPLCRADVHKLQLRSLAVPPRPVSHGLEAGAEEGAKLEALIAILKTDIAQHPKTVIFTHFAAAQSLICQRLKAEEIAFAQIAVGSSQRQRMKALHSFTSDPTVSIFVLSVKVASVGITLTCASRLVLYEPGLNLAAEQQAIGRVYRFGQQRPVHIIKLALLQTVEIPILELNQAGAKEIEQQQERWQPPAELATDAQGEAVSEEVLNQFCKIKESFMRSSERSGEQKTLDAQQLLSILGLSVDQLQQG
jgi:SNF2 family DNA or RNA helicase